MNPLNIKILHIDITSKCNGKCFCCSRNEFNYKLNYDIPFYIIEKILYEMLNLKTIIINGGLGDFQFHDDIFKIISYIKKSNINLEISTNGSKIDDKWWNMLCKLLNKNDKIIFGLDGIKTHSKYRGTIFKNVFKNMKICLKNNIQTEWQYIVFKHNEHEINKAYKISKLIGCSDFILLKSHKYNNIFQAPEKINFIEKKILCSLIYNNKIYLHNNLHIFLCCHISTLTQIINDKKIPNNLLKYYSGLDFSKNSLVNILNNNLFTFIINNKCKICFKKCIK